MTKWVLIDEDKVIREILEVDPGVGNKTWQKVHPKYEKFVRVGDTAKVVKEADESLVTCLPLELEEGKEIVFGELASKRWEEQSKCIMYKGNLFNTDSASVSIINDKMTALASTKQMLDNQAIAEEKEPISNPSVNFKSKNGFVNLTYADFAAIKNAISLHVQHTFDTEMAIQSKIKTKINFDDMVETFHNEVTKNNWNMFSFETKDFGVLPTMPS